MDKLVEKAKQYHEIGLHFTALHYWKEITKLSKEEFYKFKLADALRLCEYYSESESIYLSINVNKIPKNNRYKYYLFLGQLYKDMYRIDDAIKAYYKALSLDKRDTGTYIFLATALVAKENDKEAIKILKSALNKLGNIDEVNFNLSTLYARIGKYKEALKCINDCLSIDKNNTNAELIKADIEEILRLKGSH